MVLSMKGTHIYTPPPPPGGQRKVLFPSLVMGEVCVDGLILILLLLVSLNKGGGR
jgi:hypothetical protein